MREGHHAVKGHPHARLDGGSPRRLVYFDKGVTAAATASWASCSACASRWPQSPGTKRRMCTRVQRRAFAAIRPPSAATAPRGPDCERRPTGDRRRSARGGGGGQHHVVVAAVRAGFAGSAPDHLVGCSLRMWSTGSALMGRTARVAAVPRNDRTRSRPTWAATTTCPTSGSPRARRESIGIKPKCHPRYGKRGKGSNESGIGGSS